MGLYHTTGPSAGYLDWNYIIDELGQPIVLCIGGRGTGKTYGVTGFHMDHGEEFLYLRRTLKMARIVRSAEFTPFKSYNDDHGTEILGYKIPDVEDMYILRNGDDGPTVGTACALTTIANVRGIERPECRTLWYDEFIPETQVRKIADEGGALMRAYESLNRNRELKGAPPMRLICTANADECVNPVFRELRLVRDAAEMQRRGEEVRVYDKRHIALIVLKDSPISEAKSHTMIYEATAGTRTARMSIGNEFFTSAPSRYGRQNLREYLPRWSWGEISIYRHKSMRQWYVCARRSGCEEYPDDDVGKLRLRRRHPEPWYAYLDNCVIFEDQVSEEIFNDLYT